MGFVFLIGDVMGFSLTPEQTPKFEAFKKKYGGKIYPNKAELKKAYEEADKDYHEITGKHLMKSGLKYGTHGPAAILGVINSVIQSTADPAKKSEWERRRKEFLDAFNKASAQSDKDYAEQGAAYISFLTDTHTEARTTFLSEKAEQIMEDAYMKLSKEVKNELRNMPLPGKGYGNGDFLRDQIETVMQYAEDALNGNIEDDYLSIDDYLMANTNGALMPGISEYGTGKAGPGKSPCVSEYARAQGLLPLTTPQLKGFRIRYATAEYEKKVAEGTASREDEIKVREDILLEGADCLYAAQKIIKNVQNDRVRALFPKMTEAIYQDTAGNRGQFANWIGMHKARRALIVNGWTMADVTAVGRLSSMIPAFRINKDNISKNWDKYEEETAKYEKALKEYDEKVSRGEKAKRPAKPGKAPKRPRYSDEEIKAIDDLEAKINEVSSTAPGTEERRKELLNSLISMIDNLPESLKKSKKGLDGIRQDLTIALNKKLSKDEKDLLADPSAIRNIAEAHPVKEYTDADQERDLQQINEVMEKDKELNNIFSVDPYAHDRIREMQAMIGNDTGSFVEAVKKAVGQEEWDAFKTTEGRNDDYSKALDILTRPDSPHNVSDDHNLLRNVETAVRMKYLDAPAKNMSNIGRGQLADGMSYIVNIAGMLSPGYDDGKAIVDAMEARAKGTLFDRQNEYVERLNKVLDSPGDLTPAKQKDEIGKCLAGLLLPIAQEIYGFEENEKLFQKDNLSEKEKEELQNSYIELFGLKGGLVSNVYAEKIKGVLAVAERGINRAEELMKQDGQIVSALNLKPLQAVLKNARLGTATMKVDIMEPIIKIPEANFRAPLEKIDRSKNPIIPGETKEFTFEEVEEKAEAFPYHKATYAQYELKDIWSEYLIDKEKGNITPEKEREYWERIDRCYDTIDSVVKDLVAKQEADPEFANNNMRILFGHDNAKSSFEDSVSGYRGLQPLLRYIPERREAYNNGWPLSDLGVYSHLADLSRNIEEHIDELESHGKKAKGLSDELRELNALIKDKVLSKPYEKDPEKRAEIFDILAEKVGLVNEDIKVRREDRENTPRALKDLLGGLCINVDRVSNGADGSVPLDYELKMKAREAMIGEIEKAKNRVDEIKDIADPMIYNELKRLASGKIPPKENHLMIDHTFVERADLYINTGLGSLNREIEAVKNGKETTLEGKTGLSHERSVNAIRNMLNKADSLFHFDSKQYKAVKEGLKKLCDGSATPEEKERLTENVKQWLTDPKYDRVNKHLNNEFDNTRFNIMFTLANELDPAWAKDNFADMNIAGLHGEKAANTSFHNEYEFTNFMHRQMAAGQLLNEVWSVGSQHWYHRSDSYGQKGLIEEVLRLRQDAAYTENDSMNAEYSNIRKLLGDEPNMTPDLNMKAKFSYLNSYCQSLGHLIQNENYIDEGRYDYYKQQLVGQREEVIKQIKSYLNNTANRDNPIYDKAALAYGVLDPKGAHEFIVELNTKKGKDLQGLQDMMGSALVPESGGKIRPVNLVKLEKEQGLDLGGRKSFREKKKQLQEAHNNHEAVNEGKVIRPAQRKNN